MKRTIADHKGVDVSDLQFSHRLLAGATAGLGYWVTTYPLDAIKARMQCVPYEESKSWSETVLTMYREGGMRAFARGLAPCAARAVPACAAMFATGQTDTFQIFAFHH